MEQHLPVTSPNGASAKLVSKTVVADLSLKSLFLKEVYFESGQKLSEGPVTIVTYSADVFPKSKHIVVKFLTIRVGKKTGTSSLRLIVICHVFKVSQQVTNFSSLLISNVEDTFRK